MDNEIIEEVTAAEPEVRIVKIAECGSLSNRSRLIYQLGVAVNGDIQLRIFRNSARGYFCKDWVSWALIDMQLNEAPSFSSGDIQRLLFEGKSVNSGAFAVGVLRNEGLVRNVPDSLRCYERLDPTDWLAEIQALSHAGISLSELQLPVQPVVVEKPAKKSAKKPVKAKPSDASEPMES